MGIDRTQETRDSGASTSAPTQDVVRSDAIQNDSGDTFERPGSTVGPYRLVSLVGEGGFGSVWLAERRDPMVQQVALKLIKPGMDTRAVIARFEQERQALAVMDHPNVARVFDAGAISRGRPYFVMEYVDGEPITAYCDHHCLDIQARVDLFRTVCDAVQHAHFKGIIHRDLKPSNILVSQRDGRAIAKVIDFGIAKAVSVSLSETPVHTMQGAIIGTPEYMSPEQADTSFGDIDTRTDVYSLGAVLYELLCGVQPYESLELRRRSTTELPKYIRETEPPTVSSRLRDRSRTKSSRDDRKWYQRFGASSPRRLRLVVRGDLERIVERAMSKDRADRYDSPGDLARDLERYAEGRALATQKATRVTFRKVFLNAPKVAPGWAMLALGLLVGIFASGSVTPAKINGTFRLGYGSFAGECLVLPAIVASVVQGVQFVAKRRMPIWWAWTIVLCYFIALIVANRVLLPAILVVPKGPIHDPKVFGLIMSFALAIPINLLIVAGGTMINPGLRFSKAVKCAGISLLVGQVWGFVMVPLIVVVGAVAAVVLRGGALEW